MIIDQIVLDNFGLYAGRQEIVLTPTSSEKPVILVGGMNGGGKTTLLDALHLVFYGAQGQCAGRDKASYKDYLRAMIHRGSDPRDGASIQVSFRRIIEGHQHDITIKRSWREGGKGIEEFVDVIHDGTPDLVLSEHWSEYIESYLPVKLASLFFFDGEQIARMAEDQHAAGLLETALNTLLGLDLVDRLKADLSVIERQHRKNFASVGDRAKLVDLENKLREAQQVEASAEQECVGLRTVIEHLQKKELFDLRDIFRKEGGDLFQRREQIEADRDQIASVIDQYQKDLESLAAGPTPFLLISDLLERVEQQARFEVDAKQMRFLTQAEVERDKKVISELRRAKLPIEILNKVKESLDKYRPSRETKPTSIYLAPPEELSEKLHRLREITLPHVKKQAVDLVSKLKVARERLARLNEQIGAVPSADAIGKLQTKILELEKRIKEKEMSLHLAEDRHKQRLQEREQQERVWRDTLSNVAQSEEHAEDERRILARIPKVQSTLDTFRQRVIERRIKVFERLIYESFTMLLRKERLVTNLVIDPSDYSITLIGGNGQPLAFSRLSAGERQMLATAILWGLSKASGRPVPLVIDTPLGRLDSAHRNHFVERYFPTASHQVVLLSTDKEIEGDLLNKLRSYIGREYHLTHDELLNTTSIQKGYFNHEIAM